MNYYSYKLKRELNRIKQQLKALIEYLYEPVLRWHYDKNRAKRLVIHDGNIHLNSNKIALFLIYQPHGFSRSIFHTCNHFISQGYLPLVVCNSAVTSNDLYELKQSSWKILVRPNFGYDFGGYRDGIWLLSVLKINPDFLIIINDSIWFPIFNNDETITKMENEQADFVGALQVDQSRSVNTRRFKHPFMGSFFWLLKKGALTNTAFQSFWTNYKITSNKYKTIRRGERFFSKVMNDNQIQSHAMFSRPILDKHIIDANNIELLYILKNLCSVDERLIEKQKICIDNFTEISNWHSEAIKIIFEMTDKQNILATAPVIAIQKFSVSYIKKSGDYSNLIAMAKICEKINAKEIIGINDVIKIELMERFLIPKLTNVTK